MPAAAAERDTISEVSPSGSVGITADEPVPSGEPSSVSVDPQQAATEAAEQVQQLAAGANAVSATAAAESNGAADAAEAAPAASDAGLASAKAQRKQNNRPWVPRGQQRVQWREPQDRLTPGPVEPIPKVCNLSCVSHWLVCMFMMMPH